MFFLQVQTGSHCFEPDGSFHVVCMFVIGVSIFCGLISLICTWKVIKMCIQIIRLGSSREGRHWAVYYACPQSFIKTFSYSLVQQLWGLFEILIGWFFSYCVLTFQPIIVIYRRGNFVYHDWGCKLIYRPLSYLFRSLGSSVWLSI